MKSLEILETCLYVDDLPAAERFYANTLGLPIVDRQEGRHAFFQCGGSMLLIFSPGASRAPTADVPPHGAIGSGHIAFAVGPEEMANWQQRLAEHKVEIEKIVNWPKGGRSLYFRDPADNSLEFTSPEIWGLTG